MSNIDVYIDEVGPRDGLHSFPTRRSSDLHDQRAQASFSPERLRSEGFRNGGFWWRGSHVCNSVRSEEHTSELQSRLHLVCRLLLEKKKSRNDREMGRGRT